MPRYSTAEKADLRDSYLSAALGLIAKNGWIAFGVRKLADEVGRAPSSIHEHFDNEATLRKAVISLVFADVCIAYSDWQRRAKPGEMIFSGLVDEIRHKRASTLALAQISALAPALGRDGLTGVGAHFAETRKRAINYIATSMVAQGKAAHAVRKRAGEIVNWYIAACVVITIDSEASTQELLNISPL